MADISENEDDQGSARLRRRSRPVRVADAIKELMIEKGMVAGDRLPNETEMIETFGMSKGTIREAMRILEAQGLVETKTGPGGGSFIKQVSHERARALLGNYFYFKDLSIADIYQLRFMLDWMPRMTRLLKLTPWFRGRISVPVLKRHGANHPRPVNRRQVANPWMR